MKFAFFGVANGVLFVIAVAIGRRIVKYSLHATKVRSLETTASGNVELRYYMDYAFPVGITYIVLSCLIFLANFIMGFYNMGVNLHIISDNLPQLARPDIVSILSTENGYFFFMAGISLTNAFLIVPERSIILPRYQVHFCILAVLWLIVPILIIVLL